MENQQYRVTFTKRHNKQTPLHTVVIAAPCQWKADQDAWELNQAKFNGIDHETTVLPPEDSNPVIEKIKDVVFSQVHLMPFDLSLTWKIVIHNIPIDGRHYDVEFDGNPDLYIRFRYNSDFDVLMLNVKNGLDWDVWAEVDLQNNIVSNFVVALYENVIIKKREPRKLQSKGY